MAFPHDPYSRITRKRPRRDCNALNNGIDFHFRPLFIEELDETSASNSSSSEPSVF